MMYGEAIGHEVWIIVKFNVSVVAEGISNGPRLTDSLDAAADPYACLCLYHVMEAKRRALDPVPPRPAYAELNLPILLADGKFLAVQDDSQDVEESEIPANEYVQEELPV
jgi:hypothetical protein